MLVTNHGADVNIVGHAAGRWDHGTGVILANNIIDAHCFGANNFSTHQVGTSRRDQQGRIVLDWRDGDLTDGDLRDGDREEGGLSLESNYRVDEPLHWAPWVKQ